MNYSNSIMDALVPGTTGRTESGYYPAIVETARIVNVNLQDWTVDCVSEHGNRRFFDIQVSSPYFHYFNGEGWYSMPEVGALVWVCQESAGIHAKRFVLGFQAPNDERILEGSSVQAGGFRANRQNLNPGDMMWRSRDENFVILRRGGVVQIGSSAANQRIFIPLGSLIRDFCFGYQLQTLAGDLQFENDSTKVQGPNVVQQEDAGQVNTRFFLRVKTKANEPEHAVLMTVGSHPDDDNLRLSLEVRPNGVEGATAVISLQMSKDGSVSWSMEKDLTLEVKGNVSVTSSEGDLVLAASSGTASLSSSGNLELKSTKGNVVAEAKGSLQLKGETGTIEAKQLSLKAKTQVGGPGGEPIPLGNQLVALFQELIKGFTDPSAPFGPAAPPPGSPMLFPGLTKLAAQLNSILSTKNTTT